jgi:fused signal recognition particle receptor
VDPVQLVILALIVGIVVALSVVVARRQGPREVDALDDGSAADLLVDEQVPDGDVAVDGPPVAVAPAEPEVESETPELSLGERFRTRLARTRNVLGSQVADLFGRGVDETTWDALEEALITADVGVTATTEIVEELRRRAREEGISDGAELLALLKAELRTALGDDDRELARATDDGPTVWLVTGVNGAGKTTTIGKLAAVERRAGRDCVLAAADTFRAAAAEQLELWGERTGQRVVRHDEGTDPASVAYDGYQAARATDADLLIVDTAGRLHNKTALMDELAKVKRVIEKQAGPLEEVLLVLDGTTGQNGIAQARAFLEAVDVTGVVLTKLDGSSRGGIVVAVQRELGLPVKFVGLGEDIDDLAPFDPALFVEGLFAEG